jgi:hypothetical protein
MKLIFPVVVNLLLSAAIAASAAAGDKKKETGGPAKLELGPEHKLLESLVGTFDAEVKVYYFGPTKPTSNKGVLTRKMILGGNFLQESFTGEFFGSKFTGLGIVGFDQNKKKFVTTWCDSMSTSLMLTEGTYNADKKTLTNVGEDVEPNTKKKMKTRDVLKIISADAQTFEMFRLPEGEKMELKVMEISYTRKND